MKLFSQLKISREIKVGLVFVVAISVMIWGLMYLKGLEIFKSKRIFYAQYDYVNGLVAANPVSIKGMKVGQVKTLYFSKKDRGKIVVEFIVENDYPIPKNSLAKIVSTGLIGSKEIEIELGDSKEVAKNPWPETPSGASATVGVVLRFNFSDMVLVLTAGINAYPILKRPSE